MGGTLSISPEQFAVLVNPNARHVDADVQQRITEMVDPEHIYVSEHEDDASRILEEIVQKGYTTVFAAGGDGTVTSVINQLPDDDASPRVGILKLGTGNAMAEMISSGKPMVDLQSYTSNRSTDDYQLPLLECEGTRFAFAGLGIDAFILNDYRDMKDRYGSGPLKPLLQNVLGYFVAFFAVTIPRFVMRWLRRKRIQVKVTNMGREAYRVKGDKRGGSEAERIAPGDVLYEGPVQTVLFGTCPYFGYAMKTLPFAGIDPERFHLRVCDISLAGLVWSLRSLWKGTLRHKKLHDFQVERVLLQFSEPVPYQLAGEAMGYRNDVVVGFSERSVDLVRFI
jgi:diacylglycerol kinase family enzyme